MKGGVKAKKSPYRWSYRQQGREFKTSNPTKEAGTMKGR